ncbi:hypothetical protein GO986_20425 [Deinococcus sp. HMF7620]|uniref:Uncharacterized protein n=1 Tax=Deinococcus arboris TaxID=2682977 RepID=A0A7C9I1I0_9DEIO|nr:hypothetical protein [Deinococcus arboris]MVN89110.1 hypothetical protein [Deinococcus arboris]
MVPLLICFGSLLLFLAGTEVLGRARTAGRPKRWGWVLVAAAPVLLIVGSVIWWMSLSAAEQERQRAKRVAQGAVQLCRMGDGVMTEGVV